MYAIAAVGGATPVVHAFPVDTDGTVLRTPVCGRTIRANARRQVFIHAAMIDRAVFLNVCPSCPSTPVVPDTADDTDGYGPPRSHPAWGLV